MSYFTKKLVFIGFGFAQGHFWVELSGPPGLGLISGQVVIWAQFQWDEFLPEQCMNISCM